MTMRRSLLSLSVILLCAGMYCLAQAQVTLTGAGKGAPGPAVTYQGPGDIVSGASIWYSCGRAYNAAYATGSNGACDVVDTATGLVTCTYHIQTSGFVNPSECNGVSQSCHVACSVTKAYDQSGNSNPATQATLANMPTLTLSALKGLPCPTGNGTSQFLASAASPPFTNPTTLVDLSSAASSSGFNVPLGGNNYALGYGSTTSVGMFAGSLSTTSITAAFHAIIPVITGSGSGTLVIDGTANSVTVGTNSGNVTFGILAQGNNSNFLAGTVCEGGGYPIGFNSTQYTAMNTNMHSASNGWNF